MHSIQRGDQQRATWEKTEKEEWEEEEKKTNKEK